MRRFGVLFFALVAVISSVCHVNAALDDEPLKPIRLKSFEFSEYPPEEVIPEKYLHNYTIDAALKEVEAVVDPELLNIPPNIHIKGTSCSVQFVPEKKDTKGKDYCYWPRNLCNRIKDSKYYMQDYTECDNPTHWTLSYDDGPNDGFATQYGTVDLLAELNDLGLKATFFLLGSRIINGNTHEIVKKSVNEGHLVGNHTWSHTPMTTLTNRQIVAELLYTESAIYYATDRTVRPSIWRPPCGDIDDRVRAIAHSLGYKTVMWTVKPMRDSMDSAEGWEYDEDSEKKLLSVMKSWLKEDKFGFIALEHDATPMSIRLALNFIKYLKSLKSDEDHYMPVPLDTCAKGIGETVLERYPVDPPIAVGEYYTNSQLTVTSDYEEEAQSKDDYIKLGI